MNIMVDMETGQIKTVKILKYVVINTNDIPHK